MATHRVPGLAVAIIARGQVAWQGGVGVLATGEPAPVDSNTRFQIASISKAVTGLLCVRMAHQRLLSLQADVVAGLRSWQLPASKHSQGVRITPMLLLQHRAGINFDGSWGYPSTTQPLPTLRDLLDGVHTHRGEGPIRSIDFPDKRFRYSSGGYAILEQWLTDTQQQSFETLLQQHLFGPLRMRSATALPLLPGQSAAGYAAGHSSQGQAITGRCYYYPFAAGAGIYASITDMAKMATAVLDAYHGRDTTFLSRQDILQMIIVPANNQDYALGWHVTQNAQGQVSIYHRGLNRGFMSIIRIDLDADSAGIILTNSETGSSVWQPAISTLKKILGM